MMTDDRMYPPPNSEEHKVAAGAGAQEQIELARRLMAQYGPAIFRAAGELAMLTNSINALASDALSPEERQEARMRANLHVARLFDHFVPRVEDAAKIVECARRMDSAVDQWLIDELTKDQPLPPMPDLK